MKARRGFSLVELMIVVAIIGILAALTVAAMQSGSRNASLGGTVFEYQGRLAGLRSAALAEQRTLVAIFVADDGKGCSTLFNTPGCTRYFLIADPDLDPAVWNLAAFDPSNPGANVGAVIDRDVLPTGIFLAPSGTVAALTGQRPFQNVKVFDPNYTATCAGVRCVAFRFRPGGDVEGELAQGGSARAGHAIAFVSDLEGMSRAADRRILLVGFPSGIVKSYPY